MKDIINFDSVIFDKTNKTFTILDGSEGTYSYKEIKKCTILAEQARYKGVGEPFLHSVITGIGVVSAPLLEPDIYVGIKVYMKDNKILAIYISKTKTRLNTDLYFKDIEKAKKNKNIIDQCVKKYQ